MKDLESSLCCLYFYFHSVGSVAVIINNFYSKFRKKSVPPPSHTLLVLYNVYTISSDSSCAYNSNVIGYNCFYGASHCKVYSPNHIAIGNLIREIDS